MEKCTEENCKNTPRRGGRCPRHERQRRGGVQERRYNPEPNPECAVSHCDLEATSRASGAMCPPHYQKKYRGRDPEKYTIPRDHPARTRPTCSVPNCRKTAVTEKAGVCDYHRLRARKGAINAPGVKRTGRCGFKGCETPQSQGGYCHSHYEQLRTTGELKPLRDYGVYVTGEIACDVKECRRPATSTRLCERHVQLKNKYGLSVDEMVRAWSNLICSNPGCGETKRLHMDHNHETGRFRALLCNGCNAGLGHLKEDPLRIAGLIKYLKLYPH